jgi:hypothetical protein
VNPNYIGYAAAIIWCTLPVVYAATAPDWRKSPTGRTLMWLLGSTALLFLLLITGGLFGEYPFKDLVRAAVFAAVFYAGVRVSVLFVQLRIDVERRARNEKKDIHP